MMRFERECQRATSGSTPTHPDQWTDAGLTLDEFTQVLRHAALGQTEIKNYRKVVIANLGEKLADCWKYNKPIRLLDADADRETIELIYNLIQLYSDEPVTREELEAKTLTIINKYQPKKGDCYYYNEPSPKQILCDLTKKILVLVLMGLMVILMGYLVSKLVTLTLMRLDNNW